MGIEWTMDVLSQMLSSLRVPGAIFFNAELTAPWGVAVASMQEVATVLPPGTEDVVTCHLVTDGNAWARIAGGSDVPLAAGDIVIVPHGDPLLLSSDPHCLDPAPPQFDGVTLLGKFLSGDRSSIGSGGGGARTQFVCGFLGCERHGRRPLLAGLPRMIKIHTHGDAAGEWLEGSIRYLVSGDEAARPGHSILNSKVAEAVLVEAVRRYMEQVAPEQTSWVAGARDGMVGAALALLHREPWHPWTAAELASKVGASRSALSERFARFLGEPPLRYVARWRLQLAARLLQTTERTILQLASDAGYTSDATFNRAFKREFGLPPAQYRKRFAQDDERSRTRRGVSVSRPAG